VRARFVGPLVLTVIGSLTVASPQSLASPAVPGVAGPTQALWNVQVFLPNLATYPQVGYRLPRPSAGLTTPLSGHETNPHPVSSLTTISCQEVGAEATCIALGTTPAGAPVIVETDDSGLRWTFGKVPASVSKLDAVSCPAADRCFVAGASGTEQYPVVLSTDDGGRSWSVVAIRNVGTFAHAPLDTISCPTTTFCVAGSSALVTNAKSGSFLAQTPLVLVMSRGSDEFVLPSWQQIGSLCCQGSRWGGFAEPGLPASIGAIACGSESSCWLLGTVDAGTLMFLESTDGGIEWKPAPAATLPPKARDFSDGGAYLQCRDSLHCWGQWSVDYGLGGSTPEVPFSTSNGNDWVYETPPKAVSTFAAVSCVTTSECVAAGAGIAESSDGGSSWSADVPAGDLGAVGASGLSDVSCVQSDQCWAVGAGNSGAFVIGTVPAPATLTSTRLPQCAAGSLPAIGAPCRPEFALSSLSVAPTCWGETSATTSPSTQSTSSQSAERLEGESLSMSGSTPLAGLWGTLSVTPSCRGPASAPETSSILLQDLDGSAWFETGIRYLQPTAGRPQGSDAFFVEFQDGGRGASPLSYAPAGSRTATTPTGKETPFTDVTWFDPLTAGSIGVGLEVARARNGTVDYSVDFNGTPPATTASSSFPFSRPVFAFSCPASSAGSGGACAPAASGLAGPLDTVDLLDSAPSAAQMPGSCEVPMAFGSLHVEQAGWKPLPQPSVAVSTTGSTLAWDDGLGAWTVPAASLTGTVPPLSRLVLYAQDWAGSGPGANRLPVSAWSVQDTSSGSDSSLTMIDEPCDTWAGIPP
jgi:photosystem II stability/assembly factor-like uncharacterized protein